MQKSRRRCESTSMGSIVLDLRSGFGLGPFSLGMPICEAFAQMEQQPNIYDVVHVKYYDERTVDSGNFCSCVCTFRTNLFWNIRQKQRRIHSILSRIVFRFSDPVSVCRVLSKSSLTPVGVSRQNNSSYLSYFGVRFFYRS
ncbi:hypothetical protein ACP275_08G253600 [Erythranthe tilingii]